MTTDLPGGAPEPAAPGAPQPSGPDFFDRIRGLGVVRPAEGRWFAGVAAGISRRTGLDIVLVRGLLVALAVVGGLGMLAYGLAWLFLPEQDGRIHVQEALRGRVSAGLIGAGIVTILGLGGSAPAYGSWHWWGPPPGLVVLLVIAGVVWWLVQRNRTPGAPVTHPPTTSYVPPAPSWAPAPGTTTAGPAYAAAGTGYAPGAGYGTGTAYAPGGTTTTSPGAPYADVPPPASPPVPPTGAGYPPVPPPAPRRREISAPSHRWTLTVLGVALVAAGGVLLVDFAADPGLDRPGVVAAAVALGVIAVGAIGAGLVGRRSGMLMPIGIVLAIGTLIGAADNGTNALDGIGDRTWTPVSRSDVASDGYRLFAGDATLVLDSPTLLTGTTAQDPLHVAVKVGAGDLTVVVPDGVASRVDLSLGAGEIDAPGTDQDFRTEDAPRNWNHDRTVNLGPAGDPVLIVDVEQAVGQITLEGASR